MNKILEDILSDIKNLIKIDNPKKFILANIPYLSFFYIGNIFSKHINSYVGGDIIDRLMVGISDIGTLSDFRKSEGNYNNISNNELRKNDFSKGQKPYGIYKNIFLTDEEYKDLTNELGSRIDEYIDRLSSYMKANDRVYQDHKATIINWYLNDQAKNINESSTRKMNYDIGESL
ncbi:conjugative transfer protein Tn1549-like, CTn2-Orf5 [Clostridioides difficile]|nr:conjugative transfer protein Tn1549-like, CTn2-Orf5 [Clostridioides difficile]